MESAFDPNRRTRRFAFSGATSFLHISFPLIFRSASMPTPLQQTQPAPRAISDIQQRQPAALRPWPSNPRTHSDKQLAKLAASIRVFGFTAPVLVDEYGVILSGHGRVEAARQLNLASIPVRVASGWSAADKRAYVIADNKLALLSAWDPTLLKAEIELLIADEFEIETTGFSTAEIDLMFDDQGTTDPDDLLPEIVDEVVVSRAGDLWQLGHHKLLCADSRAAESYATLLGPERAQMCITDPPYNVPIDGHVCGNGKVKHKEFAMASGEMSPSQYTDFLSLGCEHAHAACQDGAISFIFMDWRHLPELLAAALPWYGPPRQLCVWNKDTGRMGTFYRSQHEMVYIFKKGDAPHINNFELGQHGRYRTNVWTYPGINHGRDKKLLALHPTVKPVSLIADAIRDCSHRKGLILDPFAGSGTILLAAERTGRHARAIELDPQYVDVGIHRWQRLTGQQAVLAATDQTWDQVRSERLGSLDVEVSHGL
jgi:DNA modification methylase